METIRHLNIPKHVMDIIHRLNGHNFEAYVVGGCVRDSILGKEPFDWDITTSARPEQVKALFDKTADTGIKHGTVTVLMGSESFEVTTYRLEGRYSDYRRPESVEFTSYLKDDLSRRDFTANAIAYHPSEGFIDPFYGLSDILEGRIRAVGNAKERFREDALRMLRAVRFSAQHDFSIEDGTYNAIRDNSSLIKYISAERVRDELTKILVSARPDRISDLKATGILRYILPEFEVCFDTVQNNPYHIYNVALHTLKAVSFVEADPVLRWAMLLHDVGKPPAKSTDDKGIDHFYGHPEVGGRLAESILRRLKFDNKAIVKICRLIKHHDRNIEASERSVRKAVNAVGKDIFNDLLQIQESDKKAQNPEFLGDRLVKLEKIREIYNTIVENKQCTNLEDLAVNGRDLLEAGLKPGREIGQVLDKLLELVIVNPELNNRSKLINIAKENRVH